MIHQSWSATSARSPWRQTHTDPVMESLAERRGGPTGAFLLRFGMFCAAGAAQAQSCASANLHVYKTAAGQRVRSLVSGQLAAGVHVAVWDGRDQRGRDVASGTYFARLRAGGVVQVSKMILLR